MIIRMFGFTNPTEITFNWTNEAVARINFVDS